MKHGYSDTDVTKVVMMGIAGSGKSTALDTIMEEEPLAKEERDSTPIMKRPMKTMVIIVDGKTKWVKKEQDQFTAHLATRMGVNSADSTPILSSSPIPSPDASAHPPPKSNTVSTPSGSSEASHMSSSHLATPGTSITTQSTTDALLQSDPSLPPELSVDSLLKSTEVDEEFISLISQATGSPKPSTNERWVFLLDSGGQTEFQDAFSVFLPHTSVCVFVFKLSEALDSYPDIEYYRSGRRIGKCQQSLLTNRDIFGKYMQTMYSYNSKAQLTSVNQPRTTKQSCPAVVGSLETLSDDTFTGRLPPRILLLGTHRDLKHMCKRETVQQKNESLEEMIPEKLKKQVIYREKKKLIFEINGLKPDDIDKKMADTIRHCIVNECPSRRERTPWRWHVFSHKMKSISRRLNRNVLSRDECLKIAESVGLERESFEFALEFFHNLSIIFYYPKILPDVVFVDPQVLLDKVTELVQVTFELQDPDPIAPCLPLGWEQFDKFAEVTKDFLENERFSSHYHKQVFTRKHLTTLLEKLLVFAKLSPDIWFMPCVLKHLKPHEISQYCVSDSPLLIHFPDGVPQHGVYCSLVAHVLSAANQHPSAWKVRMTDKHPACLYRNCIQFQVKDYGGSVALVDRYMYFEVHVHTLPRKLVELWNHVQNAVFNGIESVLITLGYSSNTPSPAILCPIHTMSAHPAPVRDGEWICSSTNDCGEVEDLNIPWLESEQSKGQLYTNMYKCKSH